MNSSLFDFVITRAPALLEVLENYGDMSVLDYAKSFYGADYEVGNTLFLRRKRACLDFMERYVNGKFGDEMSKQVITSLEKNYSISTADHHGPMGHPFWFQSAILRGMVNPNEAIVNFCTSHVSLGNSSYPRGIVFHGENKEGQMLSLPLFSGQERMKPVYGFKSYSGIDVENYFFKKLHTYNSEREISEENHEGIYKWGQDFLLKEKLLKQKSYSEQITLMNNEWWKNIWGSMLPSYICLDAEDIATAYLMEILEIYTIKINTAALEMIEKTFNTTGCCFDVETKKGTFLFWHLNEDGKRRALWRDGGALKSDDGMISIKFDDIKARLADKSLIPSGLLIYSLFSCYFGITCFGGFSQGTYLPRIIRGYQELTEWGEKNDFPLPECVAKIKKSILGENMVFLFNKTREVTTALDLTLSGEKNNMNSLLDYAKNQTVRNSIETMLPEIARCL